jgi:hypothetical protein
MWGEKEKTVKTRTKWPARVRVRMEATVVLDEEDAMVVNLDKKLVVLKHVLIAKFGEASRDLFDGWLENAAAEQITRSAVLREERRHG